MLQFTNFAPNLPIFSFSDGLMERSERSARPQANSSPYDFYGKPFYGKTTTDVIVQEGSHAFFHCLVHNLGNQTVSLFFIYHNQTMTEAAFFTIGRSRTIGYGKIRPLADYRSRSRLFIFSPKISNLYLICRFIHLQKLKISWKLELQWSMKLKWNLYFFFKKRLASLL